MPSSAQTGRMEGVFLSWNRAGDGRLFAPEPGRGEDISSPGTLLFAISLCYRRIIYKYFQCHSFYGTLREMVILNILPEKERYK